MQRPVGLWLMSSNSQEVGLHFSPMERFLRGGGGSSDSIRLLAFSREFINTIKVICIITARIKFQS